MGYSHLGAPMPSRRIRSRTNAGAVSTRVNGESVPVSNPFSPRVKVALAWDSAVTSSGDNATASTLTVDFDLLVRDSRGVQVASSASWDNSYEVVEFAGQPGETYDIVIRRWSGTDSVWFGVAWTVSGFSLAVVVFPFDRLSVARLERP